MESRCSSATFAPASYRARGPIHRPFGPALVVTRACYGKQRKLAAHGWLLDPAGAYELRKLGNSARDNHRCDSHPGGEASAAPTIAGCHAFEPGSAPDAR
jgi:hypothetical protein